MIHKHNIVDYDSCQSKLKSKMIIQKFSLKFRVPTEKYNVCEHRPSSIIKNVQIKAITSSFFLSSKRYKLLIHLILVIHHIQIEEKKKNERSIDCQCNCIRIILARIIVSSINIKEKYLVRCSSLNHAQIFRILE